MGFIQSIRRRLFGGMPTYDGVGGGRRALAWMVGNPGAVGALLQPAAQEGHLRRAEEAGDEQSRRLLEKIER